MACLGNYNERRNSSFPNGYYSPDERRHYSQQRNYRNRSDPYANRYGSYDDVREEQPPPSSDDRYPDNASGSRTDENRPGGYPNDRDNNYYGNQSYAIIACSILNYLHNTKRFEKKYIVKKIEIILNILIVVGDF